jgi:phage terminase large subunit GpA-like protein
VDVGGGKFDLLVRGWDRERRSWLIDRRTIRQRAHEDGVLRDIAPPKVQADWLVLEAEIDRLYPLRDDPSRAMPVAVMTIDASDGNVTWKAYEFARQMDRKRWGVWRKVRCIKGATRATAPQLPPSPTKISRDSEGKPVEPVVTLHVLGVHSLKEDAVSDLAIEDHAPGQCYFATNTPDKAFEELFNEVLIDGAWVRNGPNETLDLMGYTEAGRLMLQPDRKNIRWEDPARRPMWARPVSLHAKGGDPAAEAEAEQAADTKPAKKPRTVDRFEALNRRR